MQYRLVWSVLKVPPPHTHTQPHIRSSSISQTEAPQQCTGGRSQLVILTGGWGAGAQKGTSHARLGHAYAWQPYPTTVPTPEAVGGIA
jgi:hypothetical protein